MKTLTLTLTLTLLFAFTTTTNAQFLKKLAKKVTDKAEETVTQKTADKTSEEVSKGMDGIFSMKSKKTNAKGVEPENNYSFKYRYKMKIIADNMTMEMDYFFKPNTNYMGIAIQQQGMNIFSIFDYDKNAAFNFMENQKVYNTISIDNDYDNDIHSKSDYKVTDLPDKTILDYKCKGKLLENKEQKFTIYYTDEIGVGFDNMIKASQGETKNASAIRDYFDNPEEMMILYLETTDKTKRKANSASMECVEFKEINHQFDTGDYRSF